MHYRCVRPCFHLGKLYKKGMIAEFSPEEVPMSKPDKEGKTTIRNFEPIGGPAPLPRADVTQEPPKVRVNNK